MLLSHIRMCAFVLTPRMLVLNVNLNGISNCKIQLMRRQTGPLDMTMAVSIFGLTVISRKCVSKAHVYC